MTDRVVRKLHFTPKLLLSVAGWLTVAAVALFVLVDAAQSRAQSPTDNKTQSIADTWQGTLHAGRDLRIVVKISKADDGGYKAVFYSIDQGGDGIPVDQDHAGRHHGQDVAHGDRRYVRGQAEWGWQDDHRQLDPGAQPAASYPDARHAGDGMDDSSAGTHRSADGRECQSQLRSRHHQAERSQSAGQGIWISEAGRFNTRNTNLNDLVAFAYGLHAKQLVDAPAWFGTDLYDIEGQARRARPAKPKTNAGHGAKAAGGSLPTEVSSRQEGAFGVCHQR